MGSKGSRLGNLYVALRGPCVWEIKKWEEKRRKLKWNSVRTDCRKEDSRTKRLKCFKPTDYLMYQKTIQRTLSNG